ncbi:hypothetical protein J2T57_001605 [Natronocella acetinitrilica]|uniref:Uncharacterized protein n=1 Tax=Natronocella acetinitrilica TaxID=414046 RepID=A0AAE3G4Z7_9GAMM|nr:hypothetical protein [Natronocella acetinitrilica]MCP1674503.1 hypothetical protein [Natronocella acetinitrilica]
MTVIAVRPKWVEELDRELDALAAEIGLAAEEARIDELLAAGLAIGEASLSPVENQVAASA